MRFKKIFACVILVCVCVIGVLSLSSVSAASFSDVQDLVDGASNNNGNVNLGSNIYSRGSSESSIRVEGKINLKVSGTSKSNMATLDARHNGRIFVITNDSSVSFQYVRFLKGGNGSSTSGNAVYARGNVTVKNCYFEGCEGESGTAVAIFSTASHSTILDSEFVSNKGIHPSSEDDWIEGAAIDSHANHTTIKGCVFKNNVATEAGGAVNFANYTIGNSLADCNFTNNNANIGGALRAVACELLVNNCIFNNNYATAGGGAIYFRDSKVTLTGCTFSDNKANNSNGGAIINLYRDNNSSYLNIYSSTFKNNNGNSGGAIYSNASLIINSNCNFTNNVAKVEGGAIFSSVSCNILSSNFNINNAPNGGAIKNNGSMTISSSRFTNNKGTTGGAIFSSNNLNVVGSVINNNNATSTGGGIYNNKQLTISSTNMGYNYAPNGGAIRNDGTLTLSSSILTGNKATTGGGIFSTNIANIYGNSQFLSNSAANGAGIYTSSNMNIASSVFNNNIATSRGGAIYNIGVLKITGSSFGINRAMCEKLAISVPKYVNCSNKATIKVTFVGGNNVNNVIYNTNSIAINGATPKQTVNIPSQKITLTVNGKNIGTKATASNGIATFVIKTNEKSYKPRSQLYSVKASYAAGQYSAKVQNGPGLKITTKKVVKTTYTAGKKIPTKYKIVENKKTGKKEKVPIEYKKDKIEYYATGTTKNFNKVNSQVEMKHYNNITRKWEYQYQNENIENKTSFSLSTNWVKVDSYNYLKYRWYEQKKVVTKYRQEVTKTTYTYINGIFKSKKTSKNVKYNKITTTKFNSRNNNMIEYLESTLDCNVSNINIIKTVKRLIKNLPVSKRKDELAVANQIWIWFNKNIRYAFEKNGTTPLYGGTRLGSDKMFSTKKGTCLDQTHLMIAMYRAAGLPAYYEYKQVDFSTKKDGTNVGIHSWCRVYINHVWKYSDATITNSNRGGEIRGRLEYTEAKAYNNSHFIRINYNAHKNRNINGLWYSSQEKIFKSIDILWFVRSYWNLDSKLV